MTALVPTTPTVQPVHRDASGWLATALSHDEDMAAEIRQLVEADSDSNLARHADKTRGAYDYWWGRLQRWCEKPETRFRLRGAPPLAVSALLPLAQDGERILSLFLHDLFLGPTDDDEADAWGGPPAPSTFDAIVAALKARAGDVSGVRWAPSVAMANVLKGLRNKARDVYGTDRQAVPLLSEHIAALSRHLWVPDSPESARDRLVLELTAARLRPGDIARLGGDCLLRAAPGLRATSAEANEDLFARSGLVGANSLVVPGQRRRGGGSDDPQVITLSEHLALDAALRSYLELHGGSDGPLLSLAPTYRSGHVTKILARLSELADTGWRPIRSDPFPPSAAVQQMRAVLDAGLDWPGQVRRRRDLVMLHIGFFCALRRSELCALCVGDVETLLRAAGLKITIRRSKTSKVPARLPLHRPTSAVPPYLDSVHLVLDWVRFVRALPGADASTPLFPALDRWGHVLERKNRRGERVRYDAMDPQAWSNRLRELAIEAAVFGDAPEEIYAGVSGHSLRRGYVTSALLAGIEAAVVAKQTRHKNLSMIQRYADELALLEGTNLVELILGAGAGVTAVPSDDLAYVDAVVRSAA